MDMTTLVNTLNATTLFFAQVEQPDANGDDKERNVWIDASDGRACWSVWIYKEPLNGHPYEVHFMPSTADGQHMDDDRYREYAADTAVDVLRCILEDWQTLNH